MQRYIRLAPRGGRLFYQDYGWGAAVEVAPAIIITHEDIASAAAANGGYAADWYDGDPAGFRVSLTPPNPLPWEEIWVVEAEDFHNAFWEEVPPETEIVYAWSITLLRQYTRQ